MLQHKKRGKEEEYIPWRGQINHRILPAIPPSYADIPPSVVGMSNLYVAEVVVGKECYLHGLLICLHIFLHMRLLKCVLQLLISLWLMCWIM